MDGGPELKQRLRDEIAKWKSIRALEKALRLYDVPGKTRTMIHRYLAEDGPTPPLPFLEAAAEVMGLRVAYLVTGEGEPTEELENHRRLVQARRLQESIGTTAVESALRRATGRDADAATTGEAESAPLALARRSNDEARRRSALLRLLRRLEDGEVAGAPWAEFPDFGRYDFIAAAARHLILVEAITSYARRHDVAVHVEGKPLVGGPEDAAPVQGPGPLGPCLLSFEASPDWFVQWADSVLNAFASAYGFGRGTDAVRHRKSQQPHQPPEE